MGGAALRRGTLLVLTVVVTLSSSVTLPAGPGDPSTDYDEVCADPEFSPPLPLAFSAGTSFPFVVDMGTPIDSISVATVTIQFDATDPFDPRDLWFIDRWGGQENLGSVSTVDAISNNVWESTTGEFLDGRFESTLLAEKGSFVVSSVRFCVRRAPPGDPGWCTLPVGLANPYGRSTSLALDSVGAPRIAWQDYDTTWAHQAAWASSGWSITNVVETSYLGYAALAVDSANRSHLAYYNFGRREVGHAEETDHGWVSEPAATGVYSPIGSISLSVDGSRDPHIAFYEAGDLIYARRAGGAWSQETIDSDGNAGFHNSIVLERSGAPLVLYAAETPDGRFEIRYASRAGGTWSSEVVADAGTVNPGNWVGGYVSLALDAAGDPHAAFFHVRELSLRHAWREGGTWRTERVDVPQEPWQVLGMYTSIAVDSSGRPHIAYYDFWNKDVKYARHTGTSWSTERAVATGNVGWSVNLALDAQDRPHLAFRDAFTGDVVYASREPCPETEPSLTADAGGPYCAMEGEAVAFDASASSHPGGEPLTFRWDWDNDGTWDETTTDAIAYHVFGDDLTEATVGLEVSDAGGRSDTDTATVTVQDVAPTVLQSLSAEWRVDMLLRIAGEKFHDVSLRLFEDGDETGTAVVARTPGSPDAQSATLPGVSIDAMTGTVSARIEYTPDDDPANGQPEGATPAWLILRGEDGSEAWIPHTFNAGQPGTWTWVVGDFRPYLAAFPLALRFEVEDPGSDDLEVTLDRGDGSTYTEVVYNDGVGPDPPNSPDVKPVRVTIRQSVAFPGPGGYAVRVTARDDDGGIGQRTFLLTLR